MQKVYNTLTRKKEVLKPKKLRLFVCGVTTYDFSHIGHARTYIAFDMIVKYLRQTGYDVFYLQNVTDIDDKIIKRSQKLGQSPLLLARRFEKEYMADMKALGVNSVSKYARATSHIKEIINQVERLLKKGYAYEIAGDGIYFDISKFKEYGKLSGRTTEQAQDAISRIDDSSRKRNKGDFALWKFSRSTGSGQASPEPKWKSPWGYGRPGWHIEDTAITETYFGPQYDIHGGAQDLIFPHHEAEITQMESVSGKSPLVNYWMHTGFLTVKGEKMSKSLGNFITIRDFLKNHPARLLRYFLIKTHYRSPIDYSEEMLDQSRNELSKIDEFVDRLKDLSKANFFVAPHGGTFLARSRPLFEKAFADDFNTPLALGILFAVVGRGNAEMDRGKMNSDRAKEILDFLKDIDEFFGFMFGGREKITIPAEIKQLAEEREIRRTQGNFQEADMLRVAINKQGWNVEDTSSGPKLKQIK